MQTLSVWPDGNGGPRKPDFEVAAADFGRPVFVAAGLSVGGWEVERAFVGQGHAEKNARRLFTVSYRPEPGLLRVTTVHPETQSPVEDIVGDLMFAWAAENSDPDIQDFEYVEQLGQRFGDPLITRGGGTVSVDKATYSADRYAAGGVEVLFVAALEMFVAGGASPELTTWKAAALTG